MISYITKYMSLRNHRKKHPLDCFTIIYLNARVIQFIGSLMDSSMSLAAIKMYVGFELGTFKSMFFVHF